MTSRSGLSALWSADTTTWRSRALCQDVDPRLFEPADQDSHPDDAVEVRNQITAVRWAEARRICSNCPVRTECETEREPQDGIATVRGGLLPYERAGKVPKSLTGGTTGGQRGRPKKVASEALMRRFATLSTEGYTDQEIAKETGLGREMIRRVRQDWLTKLFRSNEPDGVLARAYTVPSTGKKSGNWRAAKNCGPCWTLARSACGTLFHVAFQKGGRGHSLILPSYRFEVVRSDVPILKGSRGPTVGM